MFCCCNKNKEKDKVEKKITEDEIKEGLWALIRKFLSKYCPLFKKIEEEEEEGK